MKQQLRREIVDFLSELPLLQKERGRRTTMQEAGLDMMLPDIDLRDPTRRSLMELVIVLDAHGTIGNTPAMVVFLKDIARRLGNDKRKTLQGFCKRYIQQQADTQQQLQRQLVVPDAVIISQQSQKKSRSPGCRDHQKTAPFNGRRHQFPDQHSPDHRKDADKKNSSRFGPIHPLETHA